MNNIELLPCPFCGEQPETDDGFEPLKSATYVLCVNQDCPAYTSDFMCLPEEWNTRYTPKMNNIESMAREVAGATYQHCPNNPYFSCEKAALEMAKRMTEGHVLVPIEPTEGMVKAALQAYVIPWSMVIAVYKAMINNYSEGK